ncbi:hypothetical protein WN51_12014 [Melipona quadrifasciata]|uniref:Uncharacterized protein n=1 Tax=Melipona quadrifasciata TaxID=166423 RepID=A0A0M9A279_9HYME|nr:hypothetical protein WN51_12014 [Melipona quadrifasciata]
MISITSKINWHLPKFDCHSITVEGSLTLKPRFFYTSSQRRSKHSRDRRGIPGNPRERKIHAQETDRSPPREEKSRRVNHRLPIPFISKPRTDLSQKRTLREIESMSVHLRMSKKRKR